MLPNKKTPDKTIVKRTPLVASGKLVDVYSVLEEFEAEKLIFRTEKAYQQIKNKFKFQYDHSLLGEKIQIYCSDAIKVSHVHGGYLQAKEPLGRMFLNSRASIGAAQGINATYIHELVHLFTWNFHSHTLREGLADYVATSLLQNAAIGPVPADFILTANELKRYSKYWGTRKKPPRMLKTDINFRRGYYFASRVFVSYLILNYGLDSFMRLYASSDPEQAILSIFSKTRLSLAAACIAATNKKTVLLD